MLLGRILSSLQGLFQKVSEIWMDGRIKGTSISSFPRALDLTILHVKVNKILRVKIG